MNIQFKFAEKRDADLLREFIKNQPLNYPKYLEWVDKAMAEFDAGYKHILILLLD